MFPSLTLSYTKVTRRFIFHAPSPFACITVSLRQIWHSGIIFSLHTTVKWGHVCIGVSTSTSKNGRQHRGFCASGNQFQQMTCMINQCLDASDMVYVHFGSNNIILCLLASVMECVECLGNICISQCQAASSKARALRYKNIFVYFPPSIINISVSRGSFVLIL